MKEIPYPERLNVLLEGAALERYNSQLLAVPDWQNHVNEMPAPCADVVTGAAFYPGLEGIGYNDENGWFLTLYVPPDPPETDFQPIPGSGLAVAARVVHFKPGEGTVTLLYVQRGAPLL